MAFVVYIPSSRIFRLDLFSRISFLKRGSPFAASLPQNESRAIWAPVMAKSPAQAVRGCIPRSLLPSLPADMDQPRTLPGLTAILPVSIWRANLGSGSVGLGSIVQTLFVNDRARMPQRCNEVDAGWACYTMQFLGGMLKWNLCAVVVWFT